MKTFKLFLLLTVLAAYAPAQNPVLRDYSCTAASAAGTDTYACSLLVAPASYAAIQNKPVSFISDVANTGPATLNLNGLGAIAIKKVAGGVTTALDDNDIRAGQIVSAKYDGTNFQMTSQLGNAASGSADSDATVTFTDITTNNSSTTKHGFLKKLDNTATHYMDGSGAWSTPAGAGITMTGEVRPFGDFYAGLSTTTPTANIVYYYRFTLPMNLTVAHFLWALGTTAGTDHMAMAIMDGSCNKVSGTDVNVTGLTSGGGTGWSYPAPTPFTLTAGTLYHLAIVADANWTYNSIGITPNPYSNGATGTGDIPWFSGATGPTGSGGTLAVPSSCGAKGRVADSGRPAIIFSSF